MNEAPKTPHRAFGIAAPAPVITEQRYQRPLFFELLDKVDSTAGQDGLTVLTAKTAYAAVWTLVSTSNGLDYVVEPNGNIVVAVAVKGGSDAAQFVEWIMNEAPL